MARATERPWVAVVPVKRAGIAKSRLTGVTAQQRTELARAFPADCAEAALATPNVATVVMVTDDEPARAMLLELGAEVIPDEPDAGLNPALEYAREYVQERYGGHPVAVLSGDLPAITADELATALRRADDVPRAFLTDQAGDGTTLLTAQPGVELCPRFGTASRRQHLVTGAHELDPTGLPTVRRDVDTLDDLRAAHGLGVGRHTAAVLERHRILVV